MKRAWLLVAPLVTAALLVGACFLAFPLFVNLGGGDGPDPADVAQSSEAADRAAIELVNEQAAAVTTPWLAPLGEQVLDQCASLGAGTFGGEPTVSCSRTVTRYFGFDGDFAGRAKELTTVLKRSGWSGFDSAETLRHYGEEHSATSLPPAFAGRPGPDMDPMQLEVRWAQRPVPLVANYDIDRGVRPNAPDTVYREVRPLDVEALAKSAFQHHKYVLKVSITDTYADTGRAVPTPTTTVEQPHYKPCYSGSNDCVGG